jgi:predicted NUDIX family NTP pyrophosphohydrolase
MEWPPRSGQRQEFPEVDRASWFDLGTARLKLVKGQTPFLDPLVDRLGLDAVTTRTSPDATQQASLFD